MKSFVNTVAQKTALREITSVLQMGKTTSSKKKIRLCHFLSLGSLVDILGLENLKMKTFNPYQIINGHSARRHAMNLKSVLELIVVNMMAVLELKDNIEFTVL